MKSTSNSNPPSHQHQPGMSNQRNQNFHSPGNQNNYRQPYPPFNQQSNNNNNPPSYLNNYYQTPKENNLKYEDNFKLSRLGESKETKLEDEEFSYINRKDVRKLYKKLKILEFIDPWTERLRMWLSQWVFQNLVQRIEQLEKFLGDAVIFLLSPMRIVQNNTQHPVFWTNPNNNLDDFNLNGLDKNIQIEILKIRKYVDVLGCTSLEYVIKRIKILASGTCLINYNWNSGGNLDDRKWSNDFPTDSQLVMHVFCTFMDEKVVPISTSTKDHPFTLQHFMKAPADPKNLNINIVIYQTTQHPPHYNILATNPKDNTIETYQVIKGRNNLFHTIIIFVHYIKNYQKGFLYNNYLGSSDFRLLQIIEEDI